MICRTDTVKVETLPSGREFRLLEPFCYMAHPLHIEVPKGFVTDFASIPRVLWRLFPPWDSHMPAAVVHDWLYRKGTLVDRAHSVPRIRPSTRFEADRIFLEHMDQLCVPLWKRQTIYRGVRAGGWWAWSQNRKT